MRCLWFVGVVGLSLCFAQLAHAHEPLVVSGVVVDRDDGQPVSGVTVTVDGAAAAAVSDSDGTFFLGDVPRARVTLRAGGPSVKPVAMDFDFSLASETSAPVIVKVRVLDQDEYSVVVTAARARVFTASTTVLGPRDIAAAPRRNAEEILRSVPGVALVQHGSEGKGHQFFIRGFDAVHGADLEITVDGLPVNEWSNIHAQGYLDLGIVIPEAVESVEVTKGPFSLDQGLFAMAGSAAYRLGIAPAERGVRVGTTLGTTGRTRVVASLSAPKGDGSEFFVIEALRDPSFGQNREILRGGVLGRLHLLNAPRWGRLSLLGAASVADFELPGILRKEDIDAGRVGFYDAYDAASRGESRRGVLALMYARSAGAHRVEAQIHAGVRRLRLLENFTGYLFDPVNGDRRSQKHQAVSFGAVLRHDAKLSRRLTLQSGLGIRGDALDQAQDHVGQDEQRLARERDLRGLQLAEHALLGVRFAPTSGIWMSGGVRLDAVAIRASDELAGSERWGMNLALSPRLAAEWKASSTWRWFAAVGRGLRPPEARAFTTFTPTDMGFSDEVRDTGSPQITMATSTEVGGRWIPGRYVGVGVAAFATFIDRESVFDHVSGVNLELNGTRRVGAEVFVQSSPTSWLTLAADTTFVDARFVESGNRVPLAPWLVAGVRAVATHPSGWSAGLRALGHAPRPLPHGAEGAARFSVDGTAGLKLGRFQLHLELENLLAQDIQEGEAHYASAWGEGAPSQLPVLHTIAGAPFGARVTLTASF